MVRFYNLLVYNPDTKQLDYTKYNFNFEQYRSDFNIISPDRNLIFADFWLRNNYDDTKPYIVYEDFKKYFKTDPALISQMRTYVDKYGCFHRNYLANISPNIPYEQQYDRQFDMIEYTEDEVRRLQDYLYTEGTEFSYTKYNFNFEKYRNDFRIWGNNLVVFTDFVIRCYHSSGVVLTTASYGITDFFKQYFISNQQLDEYLVKHGVYSILGYSEHNYKLIDYDKYRSDHGDLNNLTYSEAYEHFFQWGQFEKRLISFIQIKPNSITQTRLGICSVFLKNKGDSPLATGFLYNYSNDKKYIVTCYHVIKEYRDQRYIYGIFENNTKSIIAQFKIIGYDVITDVLVAMYDHTLNYNIVNKVDISKYPSLTLNNSYEPVLSESVSLIGNVGFDDNLSYTHGNIMNTRYSGGFNMEHSADTIPESVLIQTYGTPGMSGTPVLKGDPAGTNQLECIGMLIGALKTSNQIMVAVDGYLLDNVVQTIIGNWILYIDLLKITSQTKIDNFVKNGYPKAWLGITNQYNHPIMARTYKELSNLSYVGGLLITNFIIGFNVRDEKFVYSSNDLVDRNVIKFDGPLLNSNIYKRFITNGNVPIVIKSITIFDMVSSTFSKYEIGKFGNQLPYSHYVYGHSYLGAYQLSSEYYNALRFEYGPITIEYYYYDGEVWKFDTEKTGGNTKEWYVTYTDNADNKYYQHKFEFPQILIPYVHDYSISKYSHGNGFREVEDTGLDTVALNPYFEKFKNRNNMRNTSINTHAINTYSINKLKD